MRNSGPKGGPIARRSPETTHAQEGQPTFRRTSAVGRRTGLPEADKDQRGGRWDGRAVPLEA
jgi:hypothetical protein